MNTVAVRRMICCGEALIDLVPDDQMSPNTFATSWQAQSAGSPMNTATALAMLGDDSHFLGRISGDAFGRQLRRHMSQAGVGLDLATSSDLGTSLAVVSLNDSGKASYAFHFDQTANFYWQHSELPTLAADDWLHIGSLALVMAPGADVLLDWVHQTAAAISIDINVRPSVINDPLDYWQRLEPWLRTLGPRGVLKASDEDIGFLAPAIAGRPAATGSQQWREIAEHWLATYGIGMVMITRGSDGASALNADGSWTDVPGSSAEVVDTVGAGDTFMAGFLDGWVRFGRDLHASVERGVVAAAIVCERKGAQPPTSAEVDARLG